MQREGQPRSGEDSIAARQAPQTGSLCAGRHKLLRHADRSSRSRARFAFPSSTAIPTIHVYSHTTFARTMSSDSTFVERLVALTGLGLSFSLRYIRLTLPRQTNRR
jgi:hypothetical protein